MSFSINGLVSGLDTAQIISDLMNVERIPYTNLETRKSNLQNEQNVFRSINTKLKSLETSLFDLKFSDNLNLYKASSSSNSITASATTSAIPGSYNINVTTAAVMATSKVSGVDLLQSIKNGDFKIGGLDFSKADPKDPDSTTSSSFINSLGFDNYDAADSSNHESLLKNVLNYINANTSISDSTGSMIKKDDGSFIVHFSSKDANNVNITSNYLNDKQTITAGQNATFTVNGQTYTRSTNMIDDIIPGVSFTLSESDVTSQITVTADTEKITGRIKSFVTAYNDIIDMVRNNLAKPEDDQVINPLQGDSMLKDINNRLYTIFNQLTNAGFMEEIGLSIDKGAKNASEMTGKILFDEAKFTSILNENSSKVSTILKTVSVSMSDTISQSWTSSISGVLSSKLTGYDSQIKQIDERLEAMERSLEMKEARLKQQFSNMEIMMSSLKSTQSWLSSQFDALINSKNK